MTILTTALLDKCVGDLDADPEDVWPVINDFGEGHLEVAVEDPQLAQNLAALVARVLNVRCARVGEDPPFERDDEGRPAERGVALWADRSGFCVHATLFDGSFN